MKKQIRFLTVLSTVAAIAFTLAQIPGLPKPKLPGIPGLDRLMKEDPPITTSLADALTEIPFLDGFQSRSVVPLTVLMRGENGAFNVFPGEFSFEAQSYCMHAGTHGPGSGEGYLYAPLKGPKQAIIRGILQRSIAHPEIAQHDVQTLIWAILARTKPSQLKGETRDTAMTLLTEKERGSLEGDGMDFLRENSGGSLFGSLPGPLREVMEAENKMRSMFYSASAPFSELERVAVLSGEYQPRKGDRPVPKGRWSYHPEGYFASYRPHGYSHTTQFVYFSESFVVAYNGDGSVKSITDPAGISLSIQDGSLAYSQKGKQIGKIAFSPSKSESNKRKSEFESLLKKFKKGGDAKQLAAIADVAMAFESATEAWHFDAREIAFHAWMSTLDRQARGTTLYAMLGIPTLVTTAYDPSNTVATPGDTGRQRLAQSAKCKHDGSDDGSGGEGGELKKAVIDAMRKKGYDVGPDNVYVYDQRESGGMLRFVVRMSRDGKPLPTGECINEAINAGQVPPHSLEGAKEMLFGSVQFSGTMKRTAVRTVDVETGVVTGAGKGDGTDIHTSTDNAFQDYERWPTPLSRN